MYSVGMEAAQYNEFKWRGPGANLPDGSQVAIEPANIVCFSPAAMVDMCERGWLARKLLARKIKNELMEPVSADVIATGLPTIRSYGVYVEKLYVTFRMAPTKKEWPPNKLGARYVDSVR